MSSSNEDNDLIALFPLLATSGFTRTSIATPSYNCIAWAMGDDHRWWESAGLAGYHWPDEVSDNGTVKSVIALFRLVGFTRCKNSDREDGYDKVAIYGEDEEFTHVARQLDDGDLTSKIGKLADMSHPTPECLCGVEYGAVKIIMRRKRNEAAKAG